MRIDAKKILILGNGGSGKTSLAAALSRKRGLPVLHLDHLYWQQNWEKYPLNHFLANVDDFICNHEHWIIEGTPMPGMEQRMAACDVVLLLELSPWRCLLRIAKRSLWGMFSQVKHQDGCPEAGLSWKTIRWVFKFERRLKPEILQAVSKQSKRCILYKDNGDNIQDILDAGE